MVTRREEELERGGVVESKRGKDSWRPEHVPQTEKTGGRAWPGSIRRMERPERVSRTCLWRKAKG